MLKEKKGCFRGDRNNLIIWYQMNFSPNHKARYEQTMLCPCEGQSSFRYLEPPMHALTHMPGRSTWLAVGCKICCCVEFRGMQEGSEWYRSAGTDLTFLVCTLLQVLYPNISFALSLPLYRLRYVWSCSLYLPRPVALWDHLGHTEDTQVKGTRIQRGGWRDI